jgi:aspartate ammonia-lyase
MSAEPYFVKAFGYVKKAAALANRDLGVLDARVADAIVGACDRLIAGEMCDQFVTDFIQGGAGTSTNMNANEVIANLALESLGHRGRASISTSTRMIMSITGNRPTTSIRPRSGWR